MLCIPFFVPIMIPLWNFLSSIWSPIFLWWHSTHSRLLFPLAVTQHRSSQINMIIYLRRLVLHFLFGALSTPSFSFFQFYLSSIISEKSDKKINLSRKISVISMRFLAPSMVPGFSLGNISMSDSQLLSCSDSSPHSSSSIKIYNQLLDDSLG